MQKYFLFLFVFLTSTCFATNYYFSAAGNDANSGTTIANPFKTITKLNSLILQAGDTIFFKKGDTFRGQINLNATGNSVNSIVFTSYGTGNKPIISGAELVTNFTQNGNKYEKILTQKTNNFFVNNAEQTLARYPNNGRYLWLDSAQKTYLKDADLSSIPANYINNARLCIHTAQWCWEKTSITNYNNAEKITYNNPTSLAALPGYAFFLYDNINLLDTAQEWKFDSTSMLLTYMPAASVNPNTAICEAAVYTNGIQIIGSAAYIKIIDLAFDKQMNAGITTSSTANHHILIKDCYFANQYNHGFQDKGKYNEIDNCYFRAVDGIAVYVSGSGAGNCTVHHSTFRNIGPYRNSGIGTEINLSAIKFGFVDSCYAHHNDIDSTGYCGISADGGYHVVEKNIVKNAMLLNNDGAALKSFAAQSHHITFRNNFVSSSDGNTEGTVNANFITPAIYFDFNVNNCTIQDNTIYNRTQKGIFQNAGDVNNSIIGNNIYGANYGIDLNGHPNQNTADTLNGYVIKRNSIFLKTANDYIYRQVDFSGQYQVGLVDSNYYFQPYSTKFMQRPGATPTLVSFANWQAAGFDLNGKTNSFTWASNVDSSNIFVNPTDNTVQQSLGGWVWKDLNGNLVTSLVLQPWTSKILLRTATALPVQFINFIAVENQKKVTCTWEVANEVNVNYYAVERSVDGLHFEQLYIIMAAGGKSYTQTDFIESLSANPIYYRIKSVDNDGKTAYSSIQIIKTNSSSLGVSIYPNPTTSYFVVNSSETINEISLLSLSGSVLKLVKANSNAVQIQTHNLPKGIYIVKTVFSKGNQVFNKIMVQ